MIKNKVLASILSVCLLTSIAAPNASAYSGSWRLYQHKGAPSSDNKFDSTLYGTVTNSRSTAKLTSASFPNDDCFVIVITNTGLEGWLSRRGESISYDNDPKYRNKAGWASFQLETGGTSETVTGSGTIQL